jgi:hypothetical protein
VNLASLLGHAGAEEGVCAVLGRIRMVLRSTSALVFLAATGAGNHLDSTPSSVAKPLVLSDKAALAAAFLKSA